MLQFCIARPVKEESSAGLPQWVREKFGSFDSHQNHKKKKGHETRYESRIEYSCHSTIVEILFVLLIAANPPAARGGVLYLATTSPGRKYMEVLKLRGASKVHRAGNLRAAALMTLPVKSSYQAQPQGSRLSAT